MFRTWTMWKPRCLELEQCGNSRDLVLEQCGNSRDLVLEQCGQSKESDTSRDLEL